MDLIYNNKSTTVVITSSNLEIAKTCNWIIYLENGVVVKKGPSAEVAESLGK
jgi:ABC-type polysaccharide/polyol phosphate transport system ATPase subunit